LLRFASAFVCLFTCAKYFVAVTSKLKSQLGHDFDLSGSRDVIDDVIIRSAMDHFLLVGNWYQDNSNRFRPRYLHLNTECAWKDRRTEKKHHMISRQFTPFT